MASTAPAGDADSTPDITFNVKAASDKKYVLTVASTTTVADLKAKLSSSEYADIPASRIRLIYSGRVLKDPDSLEAIKIKDGHTIHLVKGAESNARQDPANQGGTATASPSGQTPSGAGNVPTNIAAGTGNNPLAQLTGARYAGFHNLPGMDMFGPDGGMGPPPDPDSMLRMMDNPMFLSQMREAMQNPAIIDMMANSPMMRDNPMARQMLQNPEFRNYLLNPDVIRMQLQMQRAMGGGGNGGGEGAFPAPGVTDTTEQQHQNTAAGTTPGQNAQGDTAGGSEFLEQMRAIGAIPGAGAAGAGTAGAAGANPFAALFGAPPAATTTDPNTDSTAQQTDGSSTQPNSHANTTQNPQQTQTPQASNPFAGLFAGMPGANDPAAGNNANANPLAQATQNLMQNPEAMRMMLQMMGGGGGIGGGDNAAGAGGAAAGAPNPFAGLLGAGANPFGIPPTQQQPPDNRPPEERYADQLRQLNDMGFFDFDQNVNALRRSGGSVQGAIEVLLSGS